RPLAPAAAENTVGYACVWLVEEARNAINPSAAQLINAWLHEICDAQGWTLAQVRIEPEWLYVALRVPPKTLPHTIAQTLMHETATRALAAAPHQETRSPWSDGYLIRTPADDLRASDIDRFIDFYRSTALNA
ncbi:MAG: transposase, partial [Anaerolineales bacterium]